MNKYTKVKYEKICLNAIKNFMKIYDLSPYTDDTWEMQYLYKKMFLEYGLAKSETKKIVKKVLTNRL